MQFPRLSQARRDVAFAGVFTALFATVCLQAPKIKTYIPEMQEVIAGLLELRTGDVSIKATTTEEMGFAGREEGLVAYATVLLKRIDESIR